MREEINQKAKKIRLLILDVDGVFTDGKLYFDHQGEEYKAFHVRDGHGIKLLRQAGVEVAVISGRKSAAVVLRMKSLGVKYIFQGQEDKLATFKKLLDRLSLVPEQVAHVGDDLPDLPIMCRVGLSIAVNDAHFAVKNNAHWCTTLPGGKGAVREVCDFMLQAQGLLDSVLDTYLQVDD